MFDWRKIPNTFWSLLTITLLGLPLIMPLLRWTAVACTHDGHLHYHRVAAMRHAWENGVYFTRWLPDLAFGYGYPFFVYREPAPLYAVLWPHLLGLPLPAAENLFYALCILASGWFMFLWVRDISGARAGMVSAVAYMSAPYVLVDALVRGNAPESLALALLPLLLWAGRRWLIMGQVRWFLTAVFSLAFLSLSHNISLLLFTPALLLYLLALATLHAPARAWWGTAVARITLLFVLGLGMTSFYPGGALLEMDAVTLQQSTTTRNNDFRYNFASLGEIFAPVAPEDPTLINPPLFFRLGWIITALAIGGMLSWLRLRKMGDRQYRLREQQWHIVLMALATAVFLFMSLSASRLIWENAPLIDFVQFPWRFVGRAALPLALLAGAPFACLPASANHRTQNREQGTGNREHRASPTAHRSRILFFVAIPLLILEAIPNLYPNECREEPFPTILTVHQYEQETGLVGVDPEGSYFPRSVQRRPKEAPFTADYQAGQMPQRLDITSLPEGVVVETAVYLPLAATLQLTSPQPFTATYLAFAFPGWQVTINGVPAPITPGVPDGLITFPVPAGAPTIELRWGSTPLRTGLTAVSLALLAATIAVALFSKRLPRIVYASRLTDHSSWITAHGLGRTDYGLLITIAFLLLMLKLAVARTDNPLHRPGPPPLAQTAVLQGGELRLNGYNLSASEVKSGATFDIDLAWTAVETPRAAYQSNIWLAGPDGLLWSDKQTFRPRLYEDTPPTIFWQPGQWGWDSREVQTLPGTPPGRYDVVLTLFDRQTLQPVTLLDAGGNVLGPTAVLGQMEVTWPAETAVFAPQYPLHQTIDNLGWVLLGHSQDREDARPGDPFLLTLFWERGPGAVDTFELTLQDGAGQMVQAWDLPFMATAAPALTLPNQSRIRSQHLLRLPLHLGDGHYRFTVEDDTPLGQVVVNAPDRLFTPPAGGTAVNVPLMLDTIPLATLSAYTAVTPQSSLTLIWRSDNIFPSSYRVFVHLVDENGHMIAQSDGEPAHWTRPTTGWLPGEYIVDTHRLTLPETVPEGGLSLRVGLYDPESGARLQTATADYVQIPLP